MLTSRFLIGTIVSFLGLAVMFESLEHPTFRKFFFLGLIIELIGLGILFGRLQFIL